MSKTHALLKDLQEYHNACVASSCIFHPIQTKDDMTSAPIEMEESWRSASVFTVESLELRMRNCNSVSTNWNSIFLSFRKYLSLLMMPGLAPVLSLPGDRMFQAKEVAGGHQRPAIIHAYGGSKASMERSLASIAPEGWIPMAAAMLGTVDKPPMWASVGLRPVVGTTIDLRVLPPILSEREKLLMLSCWQYWDATSVPNSALSQWLVGIDVEHGPDGFSSPTFLKQNFNGQEAADLYHAAHLHTLEDLAEQGPYPKVISQLALRIITYEYPLEAILAIYFLSATGHLPDKFPLDQWIEAVKWHGDTKIAAIIQTEAEWADAKIILATLVNVVVEVESQHGVVVWSSAQKCPPTLATDSYPLQLIVVPGAEIQRRLPETLHVEATGLGGRDLSFPIPWDISIRSDKEGQSVYGPSLAPMEETVSIPVPSEALKPYRSRH